MTEHRLGVIMNGVTGRMGMHQHLRNSILALRDEGGLELANGDLVRPEPVLVGRNETKLGELARECGIESWTTDLDAALSRSEDAVYFDGVTTRLRAENLRRAIAAGKHIYCEKPIATGTEEARSIYELARAAGVKHGVVQDKLWAPGLVKLRMLAESGFFGRVLTIRIEGCYWVFEGNRQPPQRPAWNYRKADGGGMILDMMPHYRYMIEELFGPPARLVCLGATQVPRRWDERGEPYEVTADDGCFALIELESGAVVQITSSWCVRVRREDIITVQVDGTEGSAVAGLGHCYIQPAAATPKAQWSLDLADPTDFYRDWQRIPDTRPYINAFRAEWELFIRHLYEDGPFPWTLLSGAKGVQLSDLAYQSWAEQRWVDVPRIDA